MHVTEDGAVVGSIDVAALAALRGESDDLSKLTKAELVARAVEVGVDTAGLNKAELVEVLEGHDPGESGGDGEEG